MQKQFFVTGTDTEVGKTLVSATLLHQAGIKGLTTAALKPVAAGCAMTEEGLCNEDALRLKAHMTANMSYEQVNPIAFKPAIAPHIAAAQVNQRLTSRQLVAACKPVLESDYEFTVVEGAGGWQVPLNPHETLADFVTALQLPVILVVGLRLGCINHALLTVESIKNAGVSLDAWVANQLDPDMPVVQENLATLAHRLNAPCLGHIPYLHRCEPNYAAEFLNIDKLLV